MLLVSYFIKQLNEYKSQPPQKLHLVVLKGIRFLKISLNRAGFTLFYYLIKCQLSECFLLHVPLFLKITKIRRKKYQIQR